MNTCAGCHGRRILPNSAGNPVVCPLCNGTGKMEPLYDRLPYYYVINEVLLALGTIRRALSIEPIADFEWVWLMANSTGAYTTQLTDGSSGRQYQNLPVNNVNQWGTAQNPFPLVAPTVLKMRDTLNYVLVDTSGGGNTIQLVLAGYQLFPLALAA